MTANDDAREYLDRYLFSEAEADYAVMLTGPWGGGKTHFIKSYFKAHYDKRKAQDPLNSSLYLYASLYGIRSTTEITDQFFNQANPLMTSKGGRLIGAAAAGALERFAGFKKGPDLIKELMTRLKGKILVFDDLERCAMPLVDVMGFINAYVEHDQLKVIVIASEDDIPVTQREGYFLKKEKLVNKTLRVVSDPKEVLKSIVSQLTHLEVLKTIRREEAALLRIFEASAKQNFRSLRSVLFDFQHIVSVSDPRLAEAPEAMAALLLLMVAMGIEVRGGGISAKDIPLLDFNNWLRFARKGETSPEVATAQRLAETYPDVGWKDWVVPKEVLSQLFESGLVDLSATDEHLAHHPLVVGYEATPAWRRLWSWASLPRSQYLEAREQFISDLRESRLTHPGVILHAAGIVIGTADFGDDMLEGRDAVEYFTDYAEDLRRRGMLVPERLVFSLSGGSYAGLGYMAKETPAFKEIYELIRKETYSSFEESIRQSAPTLFDKLQTDPDADALLCSHNVEGNFVDAAILQHIGAEDFASLAVKDWLINSRILAALVARYSNDRYCGELAEEHAWLEALHAQLVALAEMAEPPYKKLLEVRIDYYFREIGKSVEEAKACLAKSSADNPS